MRKHTARRALVTVTGQDGAVYPVMTLAQARADYRRRRVAETFIGSGRNRVRISTVAQSMLDGIDREELRRIGIATHETMVFGGPIDGYEWRYASRQQAVAGHRLVVGDVRAEIQRAQEQRTNRRRLHKTYKAAWT